MNNSKVHSRMSLFISYARADKHYVYQLDKELREEAYFNVWIDKQLVPASRWWDTILNQIEISDCIIIILSPSSVTSPFCNEELNYALNLNKPILPILLSPCDIPSRLAPFQIFDATGGISIERVLLRCVQGLAEVRIQLVQGMYPKPHNLPQRPPVPEPKRNTPESAFEWLALAEENALEGNYSMAEKLFQKVIISDPLILGPQAMQRLGEIQKEQKRKEAYDRVLRLASNTATLSGARHLWQAYVKGFGADYDPQQLHLSLNQPLTQSLNHVRAPLPNKHTFNLPLLEWVDIPPWHIEEDHEIYPVYAYSIGKYPVTNAQFQAFIDASDGYRDSRWWGHAEDWFKQNQLPVKSRFYGEQRPRENVNWYEAIAFAHWLKHKTGLNISLPTFKERRRAVIGDSQYTYPWGDEFDGLRCNTRENPIKATTSVDKYPAGASPFGVMDLSGNVWEWSHPEYDVNRIISIRELQTVYGGGWRGRRRHAKVDFVRTHQPTYRAPDVGFRLCILNE